MKFIKSKRIYLLTLLVLVLLSQSIYAFKTFPGHKLEVHLESANIILPDGRIINDYVASGDDGVFLTADLVESILGQQIYWDQTNNTLNVGEVPNASVMSDKLKIYHYDYDNIHAFLYCPDAKMNKLMTMAGQPHKYGYYFTNVFSASFNLDKAYHEITGYLGCEDFKASNGSVSFYLDDTLLKTYEIKADSLPEKIMLPVDAGSKLKLVFSGFKPDTQIDFADVYIQ